MPLLAAASTFGLSRKRRILLSSVYQAISVQKGHATKISDFTEKRLVAVANVKFLPACFCSGKVLRLSMSLLTLL